jgi:hypothetical protein
MVGMVAGARWAVTNEDAPPKRQRGSSAVKREQLRAVAVTFAARYLSFQ